MYFQSILGFLAIARVRSGENFFRGDISVWFMTFVLDPYFIVIFIKDHNCIYEILVITGSANPVLRKFLNQNFSCGG